MGPIPGPTAPSTMAVGDPIVPAARGSTLSMEVPQASGEEKAALQGPSGWMVFDVFGWKVF